MKSLLTKIRKSSGETLSESLVAIVIAALSMAMLSAMISASSHIIAKSTDDMDAYYSENNKIEMQKEAAEDGAEEAEPEAVGVYANGEISITGSDDADTYVISTEGDPVSVKYYKNQTAKRKPVICYEIDQ